MAGRTVSGVCSLGQTAALVGLRFVEQTFESVTGTALDHRAVVTAARKDGASAICVWLERSQAAASALGPMLQSATELYRELQAKSRKRKFRWAGLWWGSPGGMLTGGRAV